MTKLLRRLGKKSSHSAIRRNSYPVSARNPRMTNGNQALEPVVQAVESRNILDLKMEQSHKQRIIERYFTMYQFCPPWPSWMVAVDCTHP